MNATIGFAGLLRHQARPWARRSMPTVIKAADEAVADLDPHVKLTSNSC
ncbi:MAG: hypothetical protein ACLSVD_02040 [Eggerthellaceae bacterium]